MQSITNHGSAAPFCDWLSLSMPLDEAQDFERDMALLLLDLGAFIQPGKGYYFADGGTVHVMQRNQVAVWSFSGKALGHIRSLGGFSDVLAVAATRPHRVTRLDVALDTGEDAPEVVRSIEVRGHAGELRLSRKAVKPEQVRWQRSLGPCGRHTGTVYLGRRKSAEILARVYDKRAEVYDATGDDPGEPWTRYELQLHCPGLTLRDAADPRALFWHYGGGDLAGVPCPDGVEPWEPHGEGFELPPRRERSPYEALQTRVDRSGELEAWTALADELGHAGRTLLLSLLRRRLGLASP